MNGLMESFDDENLLGWMEFLFDGRWKLGLNFASI